MGAYANWFWGLHVEERDARTSRKKRLVRIDPERTLLVADFEPPVATLANYFERSPHFLVLPALPESPLDGVSYYRFRTATNPIQWDDDVDAAIRAGVDTVAFFLPVRDVRGQTLLRLRRLGVRRVLLLGRHGLRRLSPLRLAVSKKLATFGSRVLRELGLTAETMSEAQCRAVLAHATPRWIVTADQRPLRIAHFVTALNSGGAERQACYAALGQREQGHEVRVLTRLALVGPDAHYLPMLAERGVAARFIGSRWDERFVDAWHRNAKPGAARALRAMPPELAGMVFDLLGELLANPVDVLHCYVDDCNVVGAIAGCLAGTPAVVLSFRNGNPTHFPGLFRPWMLPWYKAVLAPSPYPLPLGGEESRVRGRPGVRLCANAEMGARDYEAWLGLPERCVPVIRNAFAPPAVPDPNEAKQWRRSHGIPLDAPLVAGVFRLQPEKRPLYFVECVARLRSLVPNLRVVLAGVGELEEATRRYIGGLKLEAVVTLLGQRPDVPLILAASDVLLLVSDWEGTPNIILEAQHLGCVPVATDAGGSREAMVPGETGALVGLHAIDETVRELTCLLGDPARRRRMAAAGRAFVADRFAPARLHEANMRLYRQALTDA
jgi:glycosyltransferase involved in cell wall biosynthesis